MKKLFIVVDKDSFFLSHRLPIGLEALKQGYNVTILAEDTGYTDKILAAGLNFIGLDFKRNGLNPLNEARIISKLTSIYKKEKPDIIHHVSMKIMMNGIIAARLAGIRNVVNAVTGLGSYFIGEKNNLIVKLFFSPILRLGGSNKSSFFIFQNNEDANVFLRNKWAYTNQIVLIQGSGVDLTKFKYSEEPESSRIRILIATRLIKDKGIEELVAAANSIKKQYQEKVEFIIAGKFVKENPSRVQEEYITEWSEKGVINYVGHADDIYTLIADSHINVLPSYREGLPKSLIEVCAVGRPIVTTDVAGCRDVVEDNVNGFLVPAKDSKDLAERIITLIEDKALRARMGKAGRTKAEQLFDINIVVAKTIALYDQMTNDKMS